MSCKYIKKYELGQMGRVMSGKDALDIVTTYDEKRKGLLKADYLKAVEERPNNTCVFVTDDGRLAGLIEFHCNGSYLSKVKTVAVEVNYLKRRIATEMILWLLNDSGLEVNGKVQIFASPQADIYCRETEELISDTISVEKLKDFYRGFTDESGESIFEVH